MVHPENLIKVNDIAQMKQGRELTLQQQLNDTTITTATFGLAAPEPQYHLLIVLSGTEKTSCI